MRFASLIKWIDREWEDGLRAKYTLLLIVTTVWIPLFLIGWNRVTVSLAVIWGVPWVALYLWRLGVWMQRLEDRQRRSRKPGGR
jgi:hypothetical protein